MNRRRIAIGACSVSGLAVVVAGALAMAGSGGSADAVDLHATPVAAVSDAAGATGPAGSAQVDTVVTIVSPALAAHGKTPATPAESLTMHGSGAYDFAKQIGSLDLTVPTGTLNEVLTPAAVYVRRAATAATATAAAVPASAWSRTAAAKVSDGNLITGGATEPSLVFGMLGGVEPGVREVGQDVVRGVPVVHYQGTLDLAKAAAALKPDASGEKQALTNASHAFATTKVPFDVYLDAQGRLRRFVATVSFLVDSTTKQVDQATTATELYGFGTPVTVAIPKVVAASGAGSTPGAGSGPAHHPTAPSAHATSPTRSHK